MVVILALLLPGCRKKHVGHKNGFIWYEIKENGLVGAVDQYDNELLPCEFKSIKLIDDFAGGNNWTDYEWQLIWETVDEKGREVFIKLYSFDDGWRYYEIYQSFSNGTRSSIAIQDYSNVTLSFPFHVSFILTYRYTNNSLFKHAPGLRKVKLFHVSAYGDGLGRGIYKANGAPIIPIERGYLDITPYEQDNRSWYFCQIKDEPGELYETIEILGVCNSQGTEIFRYIHGGYSLNYDSEKGFYSTRRQEKHYTGIKLGKNSSSFDVEPSRDNDPAKLINIGTYTQSSGYSAPIDVYGNSYYDNSSMYNNYDNNYNSGGSSGGEIMRTPTKHWHNVTRQEDCHFCHGSGRCSTCNGKGWVYNEFGLDGTHDCPNCYNGNCSHCNGTGKVTKTEQVYE